jgi:hypothetical protein
MELTLSQSSYELRDAGEVAFGILVLAILIAIGALLFGAGFAALLPAIFLPSGTRPPHLFAISEVI